MSSIAMHPLLERHEIWSGFHRYVIVALYRELKRQFPKGYESRISERSYICQPTQIFPGPQEQREGYIEICMSSNASLVTLLDVVGPANKGTDAGRRAYLATREQATNLGANLVEIDLVMHGQPMLSLPRRPEWDYTITVTRSSRPGYHLVWAASLGKSMPRFPLPLAAPDRDILIDMQSILRVVCEEPGLVSKINEVQKTQGERGHS
jgi:hypothetical protein